ncbi:MAG TPA: hypothetical protein VG406_02460 [Isosphaeraceae bacterium]|jgi:hypothetical protein|nr:hypothetical protein [Isosphaeraceae bacterium]
MQVSDRVLTLLGRVFDEAQGGLKDEVGPEEYEARRRDFVFHMTDWANDLDGLKRLFDDPDSMPIDDATTFIIGLLYHVVPHIDTAGRLLLDEISNPFVNDHAAKSTVK